MRPDLYRYLGQRFFSAVRVSCFASEDPLAHSSSSDDPASVLFVASRLLKLGMSLSNYPSTAIALYGQAWSLLEDFTDSGNRQGGRHDTKSQHLSRPFELPAGEREQLYIKLGRAYEWVVALEQARSAYDALRLYAKERGALTLEAAALNRLAAVAWQQSWDFATAHALLNESLLLVVTTGDAAAIAETEWNLGQLIHWAGDFTLAQTHAHRALELATAAGLNELIARSLFLIGRSHNIAGEWDEAIDPTMKSCAMYDTLVKQNKQGKTVSIASETSTIETLKPGTQFLWTGSPPASPLDYRAGEAYCLDLLAMSRINLGEPQAGIEAAREGLRLARDINNATALVLNANKLQVELAEVGEYEEAVRVAHEAGEFMQSSHVPALRWLQLFTLGDVKNTLFQLEEARAILDEAKVTYSDHSPSRVWHDDDRSLRHFRIAHQKRFDFSGVQILTAADNHFLPLCWLLGSTVLEIGSLKGCG